MKSLFILNKPELIDDCATVIQSSDALLLIENAAVLATKPKIFNCNLYVLEDDLIARGLLEALNSEYTAIDYAKFVRLTLEFDKSVSWA